MYNKSSHIEHPMEGKTYISLDKNYKYKKVKVLEHKEEVYDYSGNDKPLSLIVYKVLEPLEVKGNVDIDILEKFIANFINEKSVKSSVKVSEL
ncbi:hypothetical protein [Ornithinibacillus halophilus]|uniref:Uncharacterized protein n=1 Tax=Ornithinibacillus halophilus TaxID=930117 RepID=A0A1M5P7A2_9BACI|nr:hypothetical protein [Ornithinibacillus halophilus]SHG97567.1 hypothetical protein SAMN05216225_11081 [Ornithinibacillus halophilus]